MLLDKDIIINTQYAQHAAPYPTPTSSEYLVSSSHGNNSQPRSLTRIRLVQEWKRYMNRY